MKGNGAEDSSPKPPPLEWKFSQVFGERAEGEEVQEGTIFSSPLLDRFSVVLTLSQLLNLTNLVTILLLEIEEDVFFSYFCILGVQHGSRKDLEKEDYPITRHPEFRYKTEFQSHEPEVLCS
ncbi:hypothetical protein GW17_00019993 [Ensete ventricosum]|nr:hypothetical protein GW17_00019993 [Ensete ventricosum]